MSIEERIQRIENVVREIIYKHININGDDYGEDIEALFKMLDKKAIEGAIEGGR